MENQTKTQTPSPYGDLPQGYRQIWSVDLTRDKKPALLVNVMAIAITVALIALGFALQPEGSLTVDLSFLLKLVAVLALMLVYMVLHELVHGIFMRHYSGRKPHYGFTGLYAYAGSDACFDRRQYRIIALSPVALLGLVLLVLNLALPKAFWYVYLIQVMNLSGAAGDYYVVGRIARMPEDTLVQDDGVRMRFYSRQAASDPK